MPFFCLLSLWTAWVRWGDCHPLFVTISQDNVPKFKRLLKFCRQVSDAYVRAINPSIIHSLTNELTHLLNPLTQHKQKWIEPGTGRTYSFFFEEIDYFALAQHSLQHESHDVLDHILTSKPVVASRMLTKRNLLGETLLILASSFSDESATDIILGAYAEQQENYPPMKQYIRYKSKDGKGYSAMHKACERNNVAIVGRLCTECPNVHMIKDDASGATPLHYAAASGGSDGKCIGSHRIAHRHRLTQLSLSPRSHPGTP